jgi:hypothetical protein
MPVVIDYRICEFICFAIGKRCVDKSISSKFIRFRNGESVTNLYHSTNDGTVPPSFIPFVGFYPLILIISLNTILVSEFKLLVIDKYTSRFK